MAQASISPANTFVIVSGEANNITNGKFSLCDSNVCISVHSGDLTSAYLLQEGRQAIVTGRLQAYQGNSYLVAEKIEIK